MAKFEVLGGDFDKGDARPAIGFERRKQLKTIKSAVSESWLDTGSYAVTGEGAHKPGIFS
jgi:hypothetical protein